MPASLMRTQGLFFASGRGVEPPSATIRKGHLYSFRQKQISMTLYTQADANAIQDQLRTERQSFMRMMLSISIGLFGALIALQSQSIPDNAHIAAVWLYRLALLALLCSIPLLAIACYSDQVQLRQIRDKILAECRKLRETPGYKQSLVALDAPKWVYTVEKCAYASFGLSLLLLLGTLFF